MMECIVNMPQNVIQVVFLLLELQEYLPKSDIFHDFPCPHVHSYS